MDDFERASIRRELLRLGVAAGVAAVWAPRGPLWGWSQAPLVPTPPTTAGPFYPIIRPTDRDGDLTLLKGHTKRAQGQVILLTGRVLNARGEPVAGARIELWQANREGLIAELQSAPTGEDPAARLVDWTVVLPKG